MGTTKGQTHYIACIHHDCTVRIFCFYFTAYAITLHKQVFCDMALCAGEVGAEFMVIYMGSWGIF
jgi:hypothetical protein